ncbi:MAG: hypothetical protein U9N61_10875 [Euryarchaeota archaeon]|nr:hypothetical protein [Euryarchaeota archaeon]
MCEPCHSIVQYPTDFDDTDLPGGDSTDKESRLKAALGKGFGWAKRLDKWFHLSKFGAGHHKNTGSLTYRSNLYLPAPTLWEGDWWDREFRLDGYGFREGELLKEKAKAAELYHDRSVMGNMSLFRRFLETSMVKSNHLVGPYIYVEKLLEYVLTPVGGNKVLEKFRRVFGRSATPARVLSRRADKREVEKGIKVIMGFTRKRELFLPHFADDDKLWVPGGQG